MICVLIDVEILDRPCALRTLARTERSLHGPTASAPANVRANVPINVKGESLVIIQYIGFFVWYYLIVICGTTVMAQWLPIGPSSHTAEGTMGDK